jgi:hypothetical protein
MSTATDTERLDLLILARLAGPLKKPPLVGMVRDELGRFVGTRWSAAEWRERFDARLAALRERGDVMSSRLAITDAGRQRVAAALDVDPVPDWKTVKRWILPALALGLPPGSAKVRDRLKEHLNGLVLQRAHGLEKPNLPTQRQVVDALAWRQLGVETDRPLTLKAVRRHLLAQLGDGESRLDVDKLVGVLAARAVGASRPGPEPTREGLVRLWLARSAPGTGDAHGAAAAPAAEMAGHVSGEIPGEAPRAATGGATAAAGEPAGAGQATEATGEPAAGSGTRADPADAVPAPIVDAAAVPAPISGPTDRTMPAFVARPTDQTAPMAAPGAELAAFARAVQDAADREQEGRFGAHKVFVAAVWRRLRGAGGDGAGAGSMDLAAFKRRLLEANQADLLALHRADLVSVMDPGEVSASEIVHGNASFHFIESPFVRR